MLLGNGDGTFQSAVDLEAVICQAELVVVGDFNGDGRLDLAVVTPATSTPRYRPVRTWSLFLGNGDGTFQDPRPVRGRRWIKSWRSYSRRDFNGHGRSTLPTSFPHLDEVSVLLGNGDGTFQPQLKLRGTRC